MLSCISGKQRADYTRHPPLWNRTASQTELRSLHQFSDFRSRLSAKSRRGAGDVGNSGDIHCFNVSGVGILEEHNRGIYIFRELLSADGYAPRIFQCAEKQKLLLV